MRRGQENIKKEPCGMSTAENINIQIKKFTE